MTAPTTGEDGPRVPVDPRIRKRRIEVRRQEGRRRLRMLLGTAAALVLGLSAWGATRSPLLDVDHLQVQGAAHVSRAAVLSAAHLRRGEAMTDLDAGGSARRIDALPWIDRARVRREWPGTITVTVTERVPAVALAAQGGGWALADRTGRVLDVVLVPQAGLPLLDGVPAAGRPGAAIDPAASDALRVAARLPAAIAGRVLAVVPAAAAEAGMPAAPGDVDLRLRPQGIVRLGPVGDDLPQKLLALQTVLAQVDVRGLAVLDLRVPRSPVLTRH